MRDITRPAMALLVAVLATLAGACDRGPAFRIERLPERASGAASLPAAWAAAYRDLLTPSVTVEEVSGPDAAAAAVRDGRARFAVTAAGAAAGLAASEIDAVPVALIVPLTFRVEDVTADQARALVSGRAAHWRDVGGPPAGVTVGTGERGADAGAAQRAIGVAPATVAGTAESVPLWVEPWAGGAGDRKALRVDGRLPDDEGYAFVDRRVIAARDPDRDMVRGLAASVRRDLDTRRPARVTIDAVGDIMLGRDVGRVIAAKGAAYPFEAVRPAMAGADLRFGNLELPLTERGTATNKDYVFRAPPSSAAGLAAAGFNIVSLANNHALDYGAEGLLDTMSALDRAGIRYAGAGRTMDEAHAPALLTVKGIRIALLAYVNVPNDSRTGWVAESSAATATRPGVAWGTAAAVRRDVAAAKAKAEVVVVSIHSGYEYTANPNAIQRELSYAAIDAGAALVLGGHPHVLQGMEFYRGAPIIYSLGNFVFDLDDDDRRQPGLPSVLTVVFRVTLTHEGVAGVRFIPAVIDETEGRPVPVAGPSARPVLDRLYRLTDALG